MNTHTYALHPRPFTVGAVGILAAIGLATAALFGAATPAQAHDQLIDSVIEQSDSGEATALRLTYNNNVLDVGTEVLITDVNGTDVTKGAPKVSGRDVTTALDAPLSDGSYRAVWRVVSSDGHPIDGGFSFDITDGEASPLRTLDPVGEEPAEHEHEDGHEHEAAEEAVDGPNLTIIGPLLGVGAGLVAIVIAITVIVRARKNAAARNNSQNSPEQE